MLPRFDLSAFSALAPTRRGTLYVDDVFRNMEGTDIARHDLRLVPFVSDDPSRPPGSYNPLLFNPMIGRGVDLLPLGAVNGTRLTRMPGLPDGVERASLHGWDYDAEGFGNPRRDLRPMPAGATQPSATGAASYGSIDLGADQCGRLIMARFVTFTRTYATEIVNTQLPPCDQIVFIGQPGASAPRHAALGFSTPGFVNRTSVLVGHLNPPGTYLPAPGVLRWIPGASAQFGPFGGCQAPGGTYTCGPWGANDQPAGCPDRLDPFGLTIGIRVNCEVSSAAQPGGQNTNLQTFLAVPNGGAQSNFSSASRTGASLTEGERRAMIPAAFGTELTRERIEASAAPSGRQGR